MKKGFGWLFIVLGILNIFRGCAMINIGTGNAGGTFFWAIGQIVLGIWMIDTSKPKENKLTSNSINQSNRSHESSNSFSQKGIDKKQDMSYNPDIDMLGNLSTNQKMSVINLLYLIARSDGNLNKKEMDYLNTCYMGYSIEKCASFFNSNGHEGMFGDLKQLSATQKDYLVITALELMNCDARANETEYNFFVGAFEKLGYTEDGLIAVVQKMTLLQQKFEKDFF